MITFYEHAHKYMVGNDQFTSVTTLINLFKKPFDTDFWSTYKALEKIIGVDDFKEMRKYRNFKSPAFIEWACEFVDQNELINEIQWFKDKWQTEKDLACHKGSQYHLRKEDQAYKNGFEINPFNNQRYETKQIKPLPGKPKKSKVMNLWDLPDGYYPELMIWNTLYKIAGTADKVFIETIGKYRYIDLDDFKTNKEIKKTNNYDKMRTPLNKLDDCNYNHYRLQLSLYAWMLEQFGFKIRSTAFTHFNEQYKFSYGHMRKNIIMLMNYIIKYTK